MGSQEVRALLVARKQLLGRLIDARITRFSKLKIVRCELVIARRDSPFCWVLRSGAPWRDLPDWYAYDADWIRAFVNEQGAWANVPPRCNRREPICFSPHLYRARNLVERFFNKIKQCRPRVHPTRVNQVMAARFMSSRPSVMGPMRSSPPVIVTPPSSRFCPWSALRPPHDAIRKRAVSLSRYAWFVI